MPASLVKLKQAATIKQPWKAACSALWRFLMRSFLVRPALLKGWAGTAVLFALGTALTGAPRAVQAQNLLSNGSFEAVNASASPFFIRSSTSTPGWTQFGDGVDLIHNSYTQPPPVLVDASDGSQFLDMNQEGALGGIEQVVSVSLGVTYRLQLDTTAWATNSIGGTLGYALFDPFSSQILASGSYTDNLGGQWVTRTLEAQATSSQLGVRIQGLQATQAGMGLDNVRLTNASAPEPSALTLLTLPLVGMVAIRKRRANGKA
jgi:hypothetical protein